MPEPTDTDVRTAVLRDMLRNRNLPRGSRLVGGRLLQDDEDQAALPEVDLPVLPGAADSPPPLALPRQVPASVAKPAPAPAAPSQDDADNRASVVRDMLRNRSGGLRPMGGPFLGDDTQVLPQLDALTGRTPPDLRLPPRDPQTGKVVTSPAPDREPFVPQKPSQGPSFYLRGMSIPMGNLPAAQDASLAKPTSPWEPGASGFSVRNRGLIERWREQGLSEAEIKDRIARAEREATGGKIPVTKTGDEEDVNPPTESGQSPAEASAGARADLQGFRPGGEKQLGGPTEADQAFKQMSDETDAREKRLNTLRSLRGISQGLGKMGEVVTGSMLRAGVPPTTYEPKGLEEATIRAEDTLTPEEQQLFKQHFGVDVGPDASYARISRILPEVSNVLRAQEVGKERAVLAAEKAKTQAMKDSRLPQRTLDSINGNLKVMGELQRLEDSFNLVPTGPAEGRWIQMKRLLGISSPEEAEFLTNEIYHAVDLLHSKGGARAVAAQGIYTKLKKMTPEAILSTDAGKAVINALRKHMEDEINTELSSAGSQGYNVEPHLLPGTKAVKNPGTGHVTIQGSDAGGGMVRLVDPTTQEVWEVPVGKEKEARQRLGLPEE